MPLPSSDQHGIDSIIIMRSNGQSDGQTFPDNLDHLLLLQAQGQQNEGPGNGEPQQDGSAGHQHRISMQRSSSGTLNRPGNLRGASSDGNARGASSTAATTSSTGNPELLMLVLAIGGVGIWWYLKHHKKKEHA